MQRRFATLDVFTTRRFAGNPLAVVLDAQALDEQAMQTIAREFNLPETVFVTAAAAQSHRAALRIFTPARELPFAGHPTVGAAVLLGLCGGDAKEDMVLEERIGPVACRFERRSNEMGHAAFDLPGLPEFVGSAANIPALAAALSLSPDNIGCARFEAGRWSAGNTFMMTPVRSLEAIGRARPDPSRWADAFDGPGPRNAFLFTNEVTEAGHHFHARMFAPEMGITEDPATGSAVAALAGMLAKFGGLGEGRHTLAIEQGYEMGRPSVMTLTIELRDGALTGGTIAGDAVLVSEGTIEA